MQLVKIKTAQDYVAEIIHPELEQENCHLSDEEEEAKADEIEERENSTFDPPSPMEILYDKDENYPDVPIMNTNGTGWFWFGGITGKQSDPKSSMKEALEKLSSR